jgi:small subunit ribosomal protein S5
VLAKSLGSSNHANVVKATIAALKSLRRKDEIFKVRGIKGGGDGKAVAQTT